MAMTLIRPTSLNALRLIGLVAAASVAVLAMAVPSDAAAGRRPPRPVPVTVGSAPLVVPCGTSGTSVPAVWYFPDVKRPTGVVWVQHGFFRANSNVKTLAQYIAAHAGAIVVAPTLSSNPLAAGGCWINGPAMARGVAALFAGKRTALQHSAEIARGRPVTLPQPFVLSGHSAGGNLATSAAGYTTLPGGAIRHLRRVVLFDGVDFNGAMQQALRRLTASHFRMVLQIASPPSACNGFGAGTKAILAERGGSFVGVQLVGGTHIDAEGRDTDPFAVLACGLPRPANVAAVQTIAADWIRNGLTRSAYGILGGAPGQPISVGGATAIVLPAS